MTNLDVLIDDLDGRDIYLGNIFRRGDSYISFPNLLEMLIMDYTNLFYDFDFSSKTRIKEWLLSEADVENTEELKPGTNILVSADGETWFIRKFVFKIDNLVYCTSSLYESEVTCIPWSYWKRMEDRGVDYNE